jgi:multicomponent Na+:H+ antiporter subunit B
MGDSLVLRAVAKWALILLLFFAVYLYYRGHNAPGGGFIGGLAAAGAASLFAFSIGFHSLKIFLYTHSLKFMTWGLVFAYGAALIPVFKGQEFFKGLWMPFPFLGKIGTPMLFDLGVFFVVVGMFLQLLKKLENRKT